MNKRNNMNTEDIFESAHKEITEKFKMLRSWNVGADTSDQEFLKQVCLLSMEKCLEEFKNSVYIP